MILISGAPVSISEIVRDDPASSVERQLLNQMSKSAEVYRYDTL